MTPSDQLVDISPSHLRVADAAFHALVQEPRRLTLDCTIVGGVPGPDVGLPDGEVELPWLREWLLARRDNYPAGTRCGGS
jgi:hypothetical protein